MAESSSPNEWQVRADTLAHAGVVFIVYSIYIYVALGLSASLVGSFLTPLGDGPGGLWGIPFFLYLVTFLIGLPSFIFGVRDIFRLRWHGAGRILACISPLAISIYFFMIPHAIDPCVVGIWEPGSSFGSIPLCERFGGEWNIHTRFHLFLHATPTVIPVALYWVALKKWYPSIAYLRTRPML